ncbi:MAG: undecaprenyl-diphosphatase UppP [Fimbriimonadaceae bacterium]
MSYFEAIILGIIQGLTEFLPISSTAHLRVVPALVGWDDPGAPFTAVIQLGTLLAVLIYFRVELIRAFVGWAKSLTNSAERKSQDAIMGWAIAVGTVPIVVFGVAFKSQIEADLRSLQVIAWTLIGMGILLQVAERVGKRVRPIESVSMKDGLWVGLWQAVALIPGASRSGSTITGALFAGFDRSTAARFSFMLSVPSIFAAGVFSLKEHASVLAGPLAGQVIVANVLGFISGYAAIAFLIRMLQTKGTLIFTVYRIVLGVLILVLLQNGTLSPYQGMESPESANVSTEAP